MGLHRIRKESTFHNMSVDEICRRHLRKTGIQPELVGRIGCFLVYKNLSSEARTEILALSVVRVASEYGLNITFIAPETLNAILENAARRHSAQDLTNTSLTNCSPMPLPKRSANSVTLLMEYRVEPISTARLSTKESRLIRERI